MAQIVNNKIGPLFQLPLRILGFLVIAVGIATLATSYITQDFGYAIGVIMILIGAFFALSITGVKVDLENKAVKQYTRLAFFTKGTYRSYDTYPYVCIIPKKLHNSDLSNQENYLYEIYLVSTSLRGKALLQIEKTEEKAKQAVAFFENRLKVEEVDYKAKSKENKKQRHRMREV